jgi:O-antigen/teichoic acid export membrane protein
VIAAVAPHVPCESDLAEPAPSGGSFRRAAERLVRSGRPFGYGFAAQLCSAATNFALVVVAAHVLGPGGLGTLLIGFATYVLALGFLRALISEPLMARASRYAPEQQHEHTRAAVSLCLGTAAVAACLLALLGLFLPARSGHGMLLFAPWLVPTLLQDIGRSVVFRDRGDRTAIFSDATWLLVMGATIPLAIAYDSDWLITSSWGVGGCAGALVALRQIGWRPIGARKAVAWWMREAAHLARWLGGQQLIYGIVSYATVILLAGVLGTEDYGGLRAVQTIFTPLTLLGPALALPGLPMVSGLMAHARGRALRVATKLAFAITVVTAAYVSALYVLPSTLEVFFGHRFSEFRDIIVPIGLGQVLSAPAYGLTLFLKAGQRGSALFVLGTVSAVSYLILTVALGAAYGLAGAAWAATGTGVVTVLTLAQAVRRSVHSPEQGLRERPV